MAGKDEVGRLDVPSVWGTVGWMRGAECHVGRDLCTAYKLARPEGKRAGLSMCAAYEPARSIGRRLGLGLCETCEVISQ